MNPNAKKTFYWASELFFQVFVNQASNYSWIEFCISNEYDRYYFSRIICDDVMAWFDFGLLLKWFVDEKKVQQIVFNSMKIINNEYKSIRGAIDGLSEQKWWWWGRFCANIQSAKWISIGTMNCTFCVFVVYYIQLAHRKSHFNLLKVFFSRCKPRDLAVLWLIFAFI